MTPKLTLVLLVFAVFVGSIIISHLMRRLISTILRKNSETLKVDPTNYSFLKNASTLIIFIIALVILMYSIPEFRSFGAGIFASAGIFAAIIGFASQQAFSNIIGGIFIVMFKPFRVGDVIHVGTSMGTIENITLRHTVIKDFENKRIIIPNSTISTETITNNHIIDERIRRRVEFKIALDADIDKAMEIIIDELKNHPHYIDGRTDEDKADEVPEIVVRVTMIGEYFLNLMTYAWAVNPGNAFEMNCDVNKSVIQRFKQEGIEIPVPHRSLIHKNKV